MSSLPTASIVEDLDEPEASAARVEVSTHPAAALVLTPEQSETHRALAPERRRNRKLFIACAIAVSLCGTWAFWPLSQQRTTSTESLTSQVMIASAEKPRPLDLAAFQAPLWVAPIPPPAPPPPPPPPPPLKLQLIAITTADSDAGTSAGGFGALIFDPDQNKLYTVSVGQAIGERTIIRITESAVELKDSAGTRQLSLKSERSPQRETVPPPSPPSPPSPAAATKEPGEATP